MKNEYTNTDKASAPAVFVNMGNLRYPEQVTNSDYKLCTRPDHSLTSVIVAVQNNLY